MCRVGEAVAPRPEPPAHPPVEGEAHPAAGVTAPHTSAQLSLPATARKAPKIVTVSPGNGGKRYSAVAATARSGSPQGPSAWTSWRRVSAIQPSRRRSKCASSQAWAMSAWR